MVISDGESKSSTMMKNVILDLQPLAQVMTPLQPEG